MCGATRFANHRVESNPYVVIPGAGNSSRVFGNTVTDHFSTGESPQFSLTAYSTCGDVDRPMEQYGFSTGESPNFPAEAYSTFGDVDRPMWQYGLFARQCAVFSPRAYAVDSGVFFAEVSSCGENTVNCSTRSAYSPSSSSCPGEKTVNCSTRSASSPAVGGKRPRLRNSRAGVVKLATLNGTSHASALDFATDYKADAFLVQELLRGPAAMQQCVKEVNREGMHGELHPSHATEKGGWSSGVAIFSQWALSLTSFILPEGCTCKFPSRFIYRHWYAIKKDGVGCGSIYLISGAGPNLPNIEILKSVAEYIRIVGIPFVLGGDWNMGPADLESTGFLQMVKGRIISTGQKTYVSAGQESELDYFVVSEELYPFAKCCYKVNTSLISKHSPVVLEFETKCKNKRVQKIRRPGKIPVDIPQGPRLPSPDWGNFTERASKASSQGELDSLFLEWKAKVVGEVVGVAQSKLDPADF